MVPSLPLLSSESPVSVKKTLIEKKMQKRKYVLFYRAYRKNGTQDPEKTKDPGPYEDPGL